MELHVQVYVIYVFSEMNCWENRLIFYKGEVNYCEHIFNLQLILNLPNFVPICILQKLQLTILQFH